MARRGMDGDGDKAAPVPLTEAGLQEAAGEDDLTDVGSIEVAFAGFTHLTPDALHSCRSLTHLGLLHNTLTAVGQSKLKPSKPMLTAPLVSVLEAKM